MKELVEDPVIDYGAGNLLTIQLDENGIDLYKMGVKEQSKGLKV
jgi:hypothetical protein